MFINGSFIHLTISFFHLFTSKHIISGRCDWLLLIVQKSFCSRVSTATNKKIGWISYKRKLRTQNVCQYLLKYKPNLTFWRTLTCVPCLNQSGSQKGRKYLSALKSRPVSANWNTHFTSHHPQLFWEDFNFLRASLCFLRYSCEEKIECRDVFTKSSGHQVLWRSN